MRNSCFPIRMFFGADGINLDFWDVMGWRVGDLIRFARLPVQPENDWQVSLRLDCVVCGLCGVGTWDATYDYNNKWRFIRAPVLRSSTIATFRARGSMIALHFWSIWLATHFVVECGRLLTHTEQRRTGVRWIVDGWTDVSICELFRAGRYIDRRVSQSVNT